MLRDYSEFACEGRRWSTLRFTGWSRGVLFGSGARSRSLQFGFCKLLSLCCTEHLDLKTGDRRSIDGLHLMRRSPRPILQAPESTCSSLSYVERKSPERDTQYRAVVFILFPNLLFQRVPAVVHFQRSSGILLSHLLPKAATVVATSQRPFDAQG